MIKANSKKVDLVCVAMAAILIVYCFGFTVTHGHIVLNRFSDSWWHIALADQFAATGIFADDPFFENAPPFAQFGLMDYVNGMTCRLFDADPARVFAFLAAVNVALALVAAFLAGHVLRGKPLDGLICAVTWAIAAGRHGIIALAFPFRVSISLLFLLIASTWRPGGTARVGPWGAVWRGALLGVILDLHAFVGMMGVAIMGATVLWSTWRAMRAEARRILWCAVVMVSSFILVAWRWVLHLVILRPLLADVNAHRLAGYSVEMESLLFAGAGSVLVCLTAFLQRGDTRTRGRTWPFLVLCGLSLLLCMPGPNGWLAGLTSGYMARRMPLLVPVGLACAMGLPAALDGIKRSMSGRCAGVLVLVIVAAVFIPFGARRALFHRYMWVTREYVQHPYGYLRDTRGIVAGRTVLSDPDTAYFARGMAGCRAITVRPGQASPAIDYAPRDALARQALSRGPGALGGLSVDGVLIEKRNRATYRFVGREEADMMATWLHAGWRVALDNDNVALLVPAQ